MLCLFYLKLPTVTYAQQSMLRKLVGLKNSVHGAHVVRGPIVGPHCLNAMKTESWRRNRLYPTQIWCSS